MTILGVGIDIVHFPRFLNLAKHGKLPRLAGRILSASEHALWDTMNPDDHPRLARYLAVRWALKEAAYKALNQRVKPTWKELTYAQHGSEKPFLSYLPHDLKLLDMIGPIHSSVSHDGDYVAAQVVVEKRSP